MTKFKLMSLALLCVMSTSLTPAMNRDAKIATIEERRKEKLKQEELKALQEMREVGNFYEPEPTSEDCPLPQDLVMNQFWQKVNSLSPVEEKEHMVREKAVKYYPSISRAMRRYNLAASLYAGVSFYDPLTLVSAAFRFDRNDSELYKVIVNSQLMKNLPEDQLLSVFRFLKTVKDAKIMLEAGYSPVRRVLHWTMEPGYEPEIVSLYRDHGANPLQTDIDEMSEEEYSKYSNPIAWPYPELPLQTLAFYAKDHKTPEEVLAKFNYLVKDLSSKQIRGMVDRDKDSERGVKNRLQRKDRLQNSALLQCIEEKLKE